MVPVFKELVKENQNPNLKFIYIDIDDVTYSMADLLKSIQVVPTFQVYKDGEQLREFSGADERKLRTSIEFLERGLGLEMIKTGLNMPWKESVKEEKNEEHAKSASVSTPSQIEI